MKRHPEGVIIDLKDITHCTPLGAETFLPIVEFVEKGHARVLLANAPALVREALDQVPGVRSQIPIASSIDEARASLTVAPEAKAKARAKTVVDPVLLALSGESADEDAIALAVGLAKQRNTGLVLAALIEVPRSLAITSPLPAEESRAKRILEAGEAVARRMGVSVVCQAERVRNLAEGLAKLADSLDAQLVVHVLDRTGMGDNMNLQVVSEVLAHVKQEAVIYCGPLA